jgi:di/tricarboxylate transporter
MEFLTDPDLRAFSALAVVGLMFVLFLRETYPTEVVAIGGAAVLLATGLLPYAQAVEVFANPAPWTIAAMFVVMGGLVRTGALNRFTRAAERGAKARPAMTLAALAGFVVVASAFVNNTPVVVVMIPVAVHLAQSFGMAPSKLLIPLSYTAILGGTLTLIGTSTNLLVDGVARARGLEAFTIFEVTPLGLILVAWGIVYLTVIAPRLLPERPSMASLLGGRRARRFFTEVAIPEESSLIGQNVQSVDLFQRDGVRLVDVLRGDLSLRRDLASVVLEEGDRVVLRTGMGEVLGLKENPSVRSADKLSSVETTTVEALISPGCRMEGRSLGAMRLRRRYGVYVLAVHRRNQNIGQQLDDLVVRVGDTLLLEGAAEDITRLAADMDMVDIARPTEAPYRRTRAPIVLAALAAIVVLAALGVAPIFALAVLAVALILLTRCIDSDEAFSFVDGRLLALIFSMLAVGAALESAGSVDLVVAWVAPHLAGLPPFFVVWAIYLLTSILTEMVSNNAVAVVVTPVAISLAAALGIDARPLVVAVMVAASASFATPVGYQTNMLVYGPGGYRFADFLKVGIPLNLSIGLIASAMIPVFWPL